MTRYLIGNNVDVLCRVTVMGEAQLLVKKAGMGCVFLCVPHVFLSPRSADHRQAGLATVVGAHNMLNVRN